MPDERALVLQAPPFPSHPPNSSAPAGDVPVAANQAARSTRLRSSSSDRFAPSSEREGPRSLKRCPPTSDLRLPTSDFRHTPPAKSARSSGRGRGGAGGLRSG